MSMSENESVDLAALADLAHPGEVLRDWIDGHGITVAETARRLSVSRATLNRVLAGQRRIGAELAVTLEEMGWSDASFWLTLQAQQDIARVRRERRAA